MNKSQLKKELESLDKKRLIELLVDVYDKNKSVREYLEYYVQPNENEILGIYKKKIREAFYPRRGFDYNLSLGKKGISEFKKFKPAPESLIELMLWYVQCGVDFTNDFGDINEAFYSSLESVYEDCMKLIEKYDFKERFKSQANKILKDTQDIGWGFPDIIGDSYYRIYE